MSKQPIRFEEAMLKLEEVVQKLETGEVPLEDANNLYKKGMELSALLSRETCKMQKNNSSQLLIKMIIQ